MSRVTWAVFLAAIFSITSLSYQKVLSCLGEGDQCVSTGGEVFSTTSGIVSVKLSDIPVGKVIQVGELKFVKVGSDQYLSISPGCVDPVLTTTGAQKLLTYTGNYQSYTFYAGCEYQIELWGAQGGTRTYDGGRGGYTSGEMNFVSSQTMYFYLGGAGQNSNSSGIILAGGWNGGGQSYKIRPGTTSGAGATDLRIVNGAWNNWDSLKTRIMVAGGGGGASYYSTAWCAQGGPGGGLNGYDGIPVCSYSKTYGPGYGGTQTAGGKSKENYNAACTGGFGYGGNDTVDDAEGGGSGWYGGGCAGTSPEGGGGGSSFIAGHNGCNAINISTSTSSSIKHTGNSKVTYNNQDYEFVNTVMIDGAGYQWTNVKGALKQMPNPTGGNYESGVGHSGNGYARITRLN